MKPAALVAALAVAAGLLSAPRAEAGPDQDALEQAKVLFARDGFLWRTDARGKGPAVKVAPVPGGAAVRAIRTSATGNLIVVDAGGRWYALEPAEAEGASRLLPLPCGGAVRPAADGDVAVCAAADGKAALYRRGAPRLTPLGVPAAGAVILRQAPPPRSTTTPPNGAATAAAGATAAPELTLAARMMRMAAQQLSPKASLPPRPPPPPVARKAINDLVWADTDGVWRAPVESLTARKKVAAQTPLRHFLASPDGSRAVGVFRETSTSHGKTADHDLLFGFALDGKAARRKAIRDGVPVDWSWDGRWVLVQNGASACLMRAIGGEYKCWKGYTAVSIAPDGAWALLLGSRSGGGDSGDERRGDEDADADGAEAEGDEVADVPDDHVALPSGPLSLFRARLAGAYTDKPALLERVVDGAAAWIAP